MTFFVIDEVILQNASTGKDSRDTKDLTSAQFVVNFCQSTHILALNSKIKNKYHKLPAKLGMQKLMLNVPSLIHQLLLNNKKIKYFENYSFDFIGPKECDREYVRVSGESGGFLVTEDQPLIDKIEEKKLSPQVKAKKVKDAIPLLV